MTTTMEYLTKVRNIFLNLLHWRFNLFITFLVLKISTYRKLRLSKYIFTEDLDDDGDGIPDEEDDDDDDDEGEL